jgi:SpoVK/Ycf46/Vps4 family AAA+-type ATPase
MVENPELGDEGLKMIRKIEPNRPVIAIFEDLDSLVRRYDENGFLSLLDGESQVNNIVHLATTNYPERLDARFIDRPSRFDLIRYIGMPSDAARRFYLEKKEPSLTPEELDQWVEFSDGLTIPHLKEMIISIKCYGKDIKETVDRMKSMHKKKFNPTDAPALGFSGK